MLNARLTLQTWKLAAVAACLTGAVASSSAADRVAKASVTTPALSAAVYRTGGPVGLVNVGYPGHGGHAHGGYYYRGGGYCCGWGLGVGLGLGVLLASPLYYPNYVLAPPTTVIIESQQPPTTAAMPANPSRPDPVIYPRNGQSPQQLEADRQECNRWATTQAGALADSSIFMRAVDACMDGRGYTTK
jgi:hypothetical protein